MTSWVPTMPGVGHIPDWLDLAEEVSQAGDTSELPPSAEVTPGRRRFDQSHGLDGALTTDGTLAAAFAWTIAPVAARLGEYQYADEMRGVLRRRSGQSSDPDYDAAMFARVDIPLLGLESLSLDEVVASEPLEAFAGLMIDPQAGQRHELVAAGLKARSMLRTVWGLPNEPDREYVPSDVQDLSPRQAVTLAGFCSCLRMMPAQLRPWAGDLYWYALDALPLHMSFAFHRGEQAVVSNPVSPILLGIAAEFAAPATPSPQTSLPPGVKRSAPPEVGNTR